MWKFDDFSITQILREINFGNSRSAKSVILAHLGILNFAFYEILHFLKTEFIKLEKVRAPIMAKIADFALLEFPKLISREICVIEKS